MIVFDWVLIAILVLYAVLGSVRGFAKQLVSTIVACVGFVVADYVAVSYLSANSNTPAYSIAFLIIFFAILMFGSVLTYFVRKVASGVTVGFAGRLLGAVFGAISGFIVLTVIVYCLGLLPENLRGFTDGSVLMPYFHSTFDWAQQVILSWHQYQSSAADGVDKAKDAATSPVSSSGNIPIETA